MPRLYIDAPLSQGMAVAPDQDQARYLMQVMRLVEGDEVQVFNGKDGEWLTRMAAVTRRACALVPERQTRPQVAAPDIELVMALIKRGPLETVIEKSVELGVGRIRLVTTRRTNSDHTNVSRLTAIAIEAAEQCERLDLPSIEAPVKLEKLLDQWPAERRLLFCDEADAGPEAGGEGAAKALPQQQLLQSLPPGPAAILIGPEGGFDPVERERLRLHPAVIPVTLGPRILRAETAAMAALTLWQAAHGDWRAS